MKIKLYSWTLKQFRRKCNIFGHKTGANYIKSQNGLSDIQEYKVDFIFKLVDYIIKYDIFDKDFECAYNKKHACK